MLIDLREQKAPLSDSLIGEFNLKSACGAYIEFTELTEDQKKTFLFIKRYTEIELMEGKDAVLEMASNDIELLSKHSDAPYKKLREQMAMAVIRKGMACH